MNFPRLQKGRMGRRSCPCTSGNGFGKFPLANNPTICCTVSASSSSELLLTWARIYDIFNIVIVTTPENLHRDPAALAAGKGTMCL